MDGSARESSRLEPAFDVSPGLTNLTVSTSSVMAWIKTMIIRHALCNVSPHNRCWGLARVEPA